MTDRARTFTAAEKRAAAEREVRQRVRVYPGLVERRKMTQAFADEQIALMWEIAQDYGQLEEGEKLL
ncbi:MAG: hypothetical protein AAGI34_17515 [Pseudomonadota bacterium]